MTDNAEGPRTAGDNAEGTRTAGGNAVRHDRLGAAPVLGKHVSVVEWEDFCAAAVQDLAPCGPEELALAERITRLHWRLVRLVRYESQAFGAAFHDPKRQREQPRPFAGVSAGRLSEEMRALLERELDLEADPDHLTALSLEQIMCYEAPTSRELTHAMRRFRRLQVLRAGHADSDPAAPAAPHSPAAGGIPPSTVPPDAGTRPANAGNCGTDQDPVSADSVKLRNEPSHPPC